MASPGGVSWRALEERYARQARVRDTDRERIRAELAAELACRDDAILETLLALGVGPETAPAFEALPLVEVAWAQGRVHPEERWRVLGAATAFGLELGRPAHAQLELWLTRPPEPALYDAWYAFAVRTLRGDAPRARRVIEEAERVALASGGVLGFGAVSSAERAALAHIREALGVEEDRDG